MSKFKVDVSKGRRDSTVSSQWYSRPGDARFLSLSELETYTTKRSAKLVETVVAPSKINFQVRDGALVMEMGDAQIHPTYSAFGQLCAYIHTPAGYMRTLSADLAAQCVNHGLKTAAFDAMKMYHSTHQLVGATGENFGRIMDSSVVRAVRQIAGDGTGDTNWKIPGTISWGEGTYNPYVDITKDTTTLYASDRDVFMFLVDDTRPISIGKLASGDDDLVFRGFYAWNSEIGGQVLGLSTFLLRGVCQNRNLWGVQDQVTFKIRHTRGAPLRFDQMFGAQLTSYAEASTKPIEDKVAEAKRRVVAGTDEQRVEFLRKVGLTRVQAAAAIKRGVEEEGKPPSSIWDMTCAITALARYMPTTDTRVSLEKQAGLLMDRVRI